MNSGRECRFCSFFLLFQFKVHSWFPFAKVVSLIERTSSIYLELNVNTKYITLSEQFRNSIKKIVGRDQIDTPTTHIYYHDLSLSRLCTGTSNSGGVNLVLR